MMTISVPSAADPYVLRPHPAYGWGTQFVAGRAQKDPRVVSGESTLVVIGGGQSQISNIINGGYTPTNAKVENLNVFDGGIYEAKDNLMGCSNSSGGNFMAWLGDDLRALYGRVILVPIGFAATHSSEWAKGGAMNDYIRVALRRVAAIGLMEADVIGIWQQGESDVGTAQAVTEANYRSMISTWRQEGFDGPIFLAKSTWTSNANQSNAAVRAAINAVVASEPNVLAGADTDTLGLSYRQGDGLHFNAASGANAVANLWYNKIAAWHETL